MPALSVAVPMSKSGTTNLACDPVMTLNNYIGLPMTEGTLQGVVVAANRLMNSVTLQYPNTTLSVNDISIGNNNNITMSYSDHARVNINYQQMSDTITAMTNDRILVTDSTYVTTNANQNGRITHNHSDYMLHYTSGFINRQHNGEYQTCAFNKTNINTYSDDDDLIITINGQDFYAKDVIIESLKARKFRKAEERKQSLYAKYPQDTRQRRGKIISSSDFAELKAQETLREFISESEWRRYLTNGFIIAKSQNHLDRVYQIHRDERINVWIKGKLACKLCIHSNNCPPTDHVIAMKTLAELDEYALWKNSNIHNLLPEFKHLDIKYQILNGLFNLQTTAANVASIRVA